MKKSEYIKELVKLVEDRASKCSVKELRSLIKKYSK